jgi:hypothetical protein
MDSKDTTTAQAQAISKSLFHSLNYLYRLKSRKGCICIFWLWGGHSSGERLFIVRICALKLLRSEKPRAMPPKRETLFPAAILFPCLHHTSEAFGKN